jgi:hypothetical protein
MKMSYSSLGITWDEIFKGATQFNFGDHGSLIVLAKNGVSLSVLVSLVTD